MRTRSKLSILAVGATVIGAASGPVAAPAAVDRAVALSEFDGKVISVNRAAKRFRIRDLERGVARIHVTRNTRYERIGGLAGLRKGLKVETDVKRSRGRWVAVEVERKRADDDRRGRGDDDGPGDDRGGRDDD
jgi:hypothetical protein